MVVCAVLILLEVSWGYRSQQIQETDILLVTINLIA